jgi:hypothetical protein
VEVCDLANEVLVRLRGEAGYLEAEILDAALPPVRARRPALVTSAGRRVRFDRTIGFWLGGAVLGTAGCIMGACLPYHHPVAVTMSMLWWGIYLGSFGASVGALIGVLTESPAAAPSRESGGTGKPSSGGDNWAFPTACGAFGKGAPKTAKAVNNNPLAGRVLRRSGGAVTSSPER